MSDPLRHHRAHAEHASQPFGPGFYGRFAEKVARSLGTPQFLIGQSTLLIAWIVVNGNLLRLGVVWDVYPFILLNLMLSFQAAYAAPLILVASNRQAQRDALHAEADAEHREELAAEHTQLLQANTQLTAQVHKLASDIHRLVAKQ